MIFNGNQITEYMDGTTELDGTLVKGTIFNKEFNRLYDNVNWLFEMLNARNLVYNYNFKLYSNREEEINNWYDYNHPDGYVYVDDGSDGKIGYDDVNKCCKIQTSSDGVGTRVFKQSLHEFVDWEDMLKGQTVTVKVVLRSSNASG